MRRRIWCAHYEQKYVYASRAPPIGVRYGLHGNDLSCIEKVASRAPLCESYSSGRHLETKPIAFDFLTQL